MATGTIMPLPRFTGFDANGDPVAGGQLWTYIAGTSTPVATYSDVGLTVPQANPIVLNSAGRPSNGTSELGVFLTPGSSYKFVLLNAIGATVWTQDNVAAVPGSSQTVDVVGTAGQALAAGQAVYLSSGARGQTAGQWFLTDADFADASTTATITGIALAGVPAGAQGAIRTTGAAPVAGGAFIPGSLYYASTVAGALTGVAPTLARVIGQAIDLSTLLLDGGAGVLGNVALLNAANTFTASPQTIASPTPTLVLRDTTQPTDAKTFRLLNSAQLLNVDAMNDALSTVQATPLSLWRNGDARVGRDLYEKGRLSPLGGAIAVPYSASNYAAAGGGTWTVPAGNVLGNNYTLIGKTAIYTFFLSDSATTGTVSQLTIVNPVPGAIGNAIGSGKLGAAEVFTAYCNAGDTHIYLIRAAIAPFPAATGAIWFTLTMLLP